MYTLTGADNITLQYLLSSYRSRCNCNTREITHTRLFPDYVLELCLDDLSLNGSETTRPLARVMLVFPRGCSRELEFRTVVAPFDNV